jgi:hypothetical protein
MNILTLTSPHTKNADVKKLQTLLKKNAYGSFYNDKVDGEFGPYTGNAIKEAKFWLGYDSSQITPDAGSMLFSFLDGSKALPITNKVRRNSRLKQKQKIDSDMHTKALASALSFIGVAENPLGSNKVMFSDWYGITGAWCAMFQTYNYVAAGSKAFQRGNRWAYCPFVVDDARAGRNGLKLVSPANVAPGDLVLFDWNGDGVADHIGMFETWTDKKKKSFTAIEGNAGPGEVERGTHDMKNVLIFAHVMH